MPRWHTDDVDVAMTTWAFQWVSNFARHPDRASRCIGPMGCTLGRVQERHDGASSSTERDRHFPEIYLGEGLVVSVILKTLTLSQQELLWAHYVARVYDLTTWKPLRRPLKQRLIAERLGLSLASYYQRRDAAKSCVRTGLSLDTKALCHARGFMVHACKVESVPPEAP